ncbi:MAG: alanine--tRNA ligase, partial [Candidatus Omnitrophica bacterium]|nr:alanine--tRNA ligase [Candidatus Omnitrophota bacterium]
TAVMQGKRNNFETDLFQPIIKEIEREISDPEKTKEREPVYAVSDHLRAVSFSIYDGILPSNEKQGYVVRKLIRKSVLHLRGLGVQKPFLFKLVSVLADVMKNPYPDLKIRRENIADIVLSEEKNFIDILNSSPRVLEENFKEFAGIHEADGLCIARIAAAAFKLYDTHGIPLEVTKQWLQQNIPVFKLIKQEEFNNFFESELNQQKSRSKAQSQMQGDVFDIKDLELSIKQTDFCGYNLLCTNAVILKILRDTVSLEKAASGDEVTIVLDRTGFYAESGGQSGDTGLLTSGENIFEVIDTRKIGKVITHKGIMKSGSLKIGDTVQAAVNEERRLSIARNHTATHLLQAALRKVLGPHVQQQGSLVAEDRFRFDFTHFKELQEEERARVEELINGYIVSNYPVRKDEMSLEQAKSRGALAFFGEKYEQTVRVISVAGVSQELCGGTHIDATGQIGIFKIIQEGSVASGVRRIEAVTGMFAYKKIKEEENVLNEVTALLNAPLEKINQELLKRLQQIRDLGREVKQLNYFIIQNQTDELVKSADCVNGIRVITSVNNNLDMELLRKALDLVKTKVHNSGAVIVFGSRNDDKAFLVVGVTQDLVQKGVDASKLIQEPAHLIGGKGGGRKDFAQAGGTHADAFPQAFENIKQSVKTLTL